jgi:peptidyl-dipeptidase A
MASPEVTKQAREFVADHEKRIKPLDVAGNEAWWQANITGSKEAFKKKVEAQNALDKALSDRKVFARLKALRDNRKDIDDAVLARAIDVLYLLYLEKQVDTDLLEKMVEKANAVEEAFNNFRARADGAELTDNQVRTVLKQSTDSRRLQAVWEASKAVGGVVDAQLKELVTLRNQAAKKLGFKNFHDMQLYLNEQDGKELLALFDELDELTRKPFADAKADLDAPLAKRYGVKIDELLPWHYQDPFFQETPNVLGADLDEP